LYNFVNNKYINLKLNNYIYQSVDSRLKIKKYLLLKMLFIKI